MCRIALRLKTCCKTHGCRRGCQRVPTSQACCGNAFGCSAVRFLQRVPSGCRRVPTAPVGASRIAAYDLLPKTQVPTRVPAGADRAGVLRKRFRLQRRAVLAAGAERVPTGGDCASRIAAYDLRKNAGADAGASGCRPRRRVAETLSAATPCGSCRASAKVPTGEPAGAGME